MTLKELSGIYYINKNIETIKEEISVLRESAERITSHISDMPSKSSIGDRLTNTVAEIIERENELAEIEIEKAKKAIELGRYIDSIDDVLTQSIFRLRFLKCLSWQEVADKTGSSEYAVKHICYRFLNSK